MTTTGTTDFTLDVNEAIEEAWERASGGQEIRSGYQYRTARRSLNFVLQEMANKGLNLWTVQSAVLPLTQGQATYQLPADTIDLIEHVVRQNSNGQNTDINITRIGVSTYATIPNKGVVGRPVQIYIDRQRDNPQFSVWPVPENNTYSLVYWRLRRLQDAGSGFNTFDVPFRFYNALVAGLAFHLAQKLPGMDAQRAVLLKQAYDEAWQMAADEDRDRSDITFLPKVYRV